MARLNSDGTFDDSFGTNGKKQLTYGANRHDVLKVFLKKDGSLLVVGRANYGGQISGQLWRAAVVHLSEDGVLDTSFGGNDGYVGVASDSRLVGYERNYPAGWENCVCWCQRALCTGRRKYKRPVMSHLLAE